MEISKDKVVSLVYELRVDSADGEIVESLDSNNPLTFIYNSGYLLPKFEENIAGLTQGDKFDFSVPAALAYGEVNQEAIVNVPVTAFEIEGNVDENMLKIGARIPMQDSSGNKLTGTVSSIDNEKVVMDFNHPMAGNDLFFKGEVTHVREASEEELNNSGCGCGCGDSACGDTSCNQEEMQEACGCGSGGCC